MATATKQRWCDMPLELLSLVFEHLDFIGRLRFRAVCKDFLRAASYYHTSSSYHAYSYYNPSTAEAIAKEESIPWFLEYGDRYCTLLTSSNERHTNVSFKDLQGATVLASSDGWLLVFKQGSVFFLCPFSGAKIDLPNLPYSQLTNHVAASITPPTLTYCPVAIISRSADDYVDLNEIDRFSRQWTTEKIYIRREVIDTIKAAIYYYGAYYFLAEPSKDGLEVKVNSLTFIPNDPTSAEVNAFKIIKYNCVAGRKLPKGPLGIEECISWEKPKHGFCDQWFEPAKVLGIKEMLCLDDDDVELSTCGTFVIETLFFDEIVKSTSNHVNGDSNIRRVKGVWIHPRYHEITAHDAWLII